MISGCFMSSDNLVTVLGYSIVTDLMSKMFAFSRISSSWVIIFDCVIGFYCLEAVLGCLTVTDLMLLLLGFFTVFDVLWIFLTFVFKN